MSAAVFEERVDPGKVTSAVMAAGVHLLLLAILVFGIRWQNRPPESVAVELWTAPPPSPVVEAPRPEPKAEPKPEPKPEPAPPVVVKPEPEIPKPQIVERKAPPLKPKPLPKPEPKVVAKVPPKPKPEPKVIAKVPPKPEPKVVAKVAPKVEPKPVLKPEPLKPRVDDMRRMREELAREQNSRAIEREGAQIREQLARDAAAARANALAGWADKVRAKIRGNINLPEVKGNPEAVFEVVQLPNGEVIDVKLRKSSGQPLLDNAIDRAIRKSSPLPRPDRGEAAPRAFELRYRPHD